MHIEGPVEDEFGRRVRRYADQVRWPVAVLVGLFAVFAVPAARQQVTAVFAVLSAGWSVALLWLPRTAWVWLVDLVLLGVVCLTQAHTVPDVAHGSSWVCVLVSYVVVTTQWTTRPPAGAAIAVLLVGLDMAGAALDGAAALGSALPMGGWMLAEATLSRAFVQLLAARSRAVDAELARSSEQEREIAVANASQRADREHLATLHDTACSTLFMVSVARTEADVALLRRQATADVARLAGGDPGARTVDLAELLGAEANLHPITVHTELSGPLWMPERVARVIRDSAAEALRNVVRHANVDAALLRAYQRGATRVVEIVDDGVGFDPATVDSTSWGIANSMRRRISAIDGICTVRSAVGLGTTVCLEWTDG